MEYTAEEVTTAAGITVRTLGSWTSRGVFNPPEFRASSTVYSEEHMAQACEIARLRREGMGLDAIGAHLKSVAAEAAKAAAADEVAKETERTSRTVLERAYRAQRWERVVLLPGLELHIDVSGGAILERVAKQIYAQFGPLPRE